MGKHYYCPKCGESQNKTNVICIKCRTSLKTIESMYDSEYYRSKSFEKYGDYLHWHEFLMEEVIQNPYFEKEKYLQQFSIQDKDKILDSIFNNTQKNKNIPKCPTCGSNNIVKISNIKKITHTYIFGFLSKTSRSQFCCKNCGYKW